jgi:type II secretory pathway component GspD/PulD (secretin)
MVIRILSLAVLSSFLAAGQTRATGTLSFHNAPLVEVINRLAVAAKINYVLDPRVRIAKSVNTYGESQNLDAGNLLNLILRINGAQVAAGDGDVVRIVPLREASDRAEETMLDLVFLKNMPAEEISRLLSQTGGRATMVPYAPAGLLMILR